MAYKHIEDDFVNDGNSLGEAIDDVGGLSVHYHTYKFGLNGKETPLIVAVTGEQCFFLACVQI